MSHLVLKVSGVKEPFGKDPITGLELEKEVSVCWVENEADGFDFVRECARGSNG